MRLNLGWFLNLKLSTKLRDNFLLSNKILLGGLVYHIINKDYLN
jgi:hypothetical protein